MTLITITMKLMASEMNCVGVVNAWVAPIPARRPFRSRTYHSRHTNEQSESFAGMIGAMRGGCTERWKTGKYGVPMPTTGSQPRVALKP